jgi:glutamyl-tRNA synthetase
MTIIRSRRLSSRLPTARSHQIRTVAALRSSGRKNVGVSSGRFAPSPTGTLHVGNLRTALVAWIAARSSGRDFTVRIEDLDRANSSVLHERSQLRDLRALGLEFSNDVVRQSERFAEYEKAISHLTDHGLTYPCYCTRREIRESASAPHGDLPEGAYPGTCRDLSLAERRVREDAGRPPAIRLRTNEERYRFRDLLVGEVEGGVDDVVLRRNDGVPAYNLAVVVDDAWQGIDQVVRGDDLLMSTPRQMHLQRLLGLPHPEYGHVPLVLGHDGERLAKRHGAVTLEDLSEMSEDPAAVRTELLASLGLSTDPVEAARGFDWATIRRSPWMIPSRWQTRNP